MAIVRVEKCGGLAGFGGSNARIRSHGQVDISELSPEEQKAVNALFRSATAELSRSADSFRYRISRTTAAGTETVEVPEDHVPNALASCVKDEFV